MISVDYREDRPKRLEQDQLRGIITRIGVKAERASLQYGDVAFEGHGPKGTVAVAVERKRLHDILNCIDDGRYNAQRAGMASVYDINFLLVEGWWRPHDPTGIIMESHDGCKWWECRPAGQRVMYAKLRRYLFSVQLSGVHILYTRDIWQSAYDLCELYHYFQKRWRDHTSLLQMQRFALPTLNGKPTLVRRWANDLDGVGIIHSEAAERLFKTPIALANSSEMEWLSIPGIGPKTAQSICAEIEGKK